MGAPAGRYAYSDTGYILLGEIAERSSGAPLALTVHTLLAFDRLRLDETCWESLEPAPPGITGRAHQYIGGLDGYGLDPSFALYGAAGLVSTVDDLSVFYRRSYRANCSPDRRRSPPCWRFRRATPAREPAWPSFATTLPAVHVSLGSKSPNEGGDRNE